MSTTTTSTPNRTEQRQCDKHGGYEAKLLFGTRFTSCPGCDADAEQRLRERDAERRRREIEERKEEYARECGAVGRFRSASLDTFQARTKEQRAVLAACRSFCETFRKDQGSGLILIGPVGVGKTFLGASLVLDVIQRHAAPAKIITARALIREIRDTWRKDSDRSEEDVVGMYSSLWLLVLDEVGVGFGTDQERTQLLDVIDARYQRQRPTVVLGNLNLPELREALGDRSFDRIREGAQTLVMNWASHRGAAA